jgi:hypothetical protein
MNAWNVPQVTRTTLTALAGILVAINLKYKWLPLTEHDTAMVAGSDQGGMPMQAILQRLEALEQK